MSRQALEGGERTLLAWGAALSVLIASGCARSSERAIEKTRVVTGEEARVHWNATWDERFGTGFGPRRVTQGPPAALAFQTPAGWSERPPEGMRAVDFQVAGDERAECYLVFLPGDAGGLRANVDRWRGQLGLAPATDAELEALSPGTLLGRAAVRIELERGDDALVGLLAIDAERSCFLKLTGPAAVLAAEREAFDTLASSLRETGSETGSEPATAAAPEPPRGAGGLAWEAPSTWTAMPDQTFRLASWTAGDAQAVECYITVLAGDGGGVQANLERWRGQMGAAPSTDAVSDDLPRVEMLGGEAVLLEVAGTYRGMDGAQVPEALLLGAIRALPGRAVFVKMIGPRDAVEREREGFLALCRSMQEAG